MTEETEATSTATRRHAVSILKANSFRVVDGKQIVGTCFKVAGSNYLITCAHVVTNAWSQSNSTLRILDANDTSHVFEVTAGDRGLDVAILSCPTFPEVEGLCLGSYDDIEEGDEVLFTGFPFGYDYHVTHKGMVSAKALINGRQSIQVDASVNRGNSGGPCAVYRDGNVVVVGIVATRLVGYNHAVFDREHASLLKQIQGFGENYGIVIGVTRMLGMVFNIFSPILKEMDRFLNVGFGEAVSIDYAKSAIASISNGED